MAYYRERLASLIHEYAAEFVRDHASEQSLITVTAVTLSKDAQHATIFISVYPLEQSGTALAFVTRQAGELHKILGTSGSLSHAPRISFALDPQSRLAG